MDLAMDHAAVEVRNVCHCKTTTGLAAVKLTDLLGCQRLKKTLPSLSHGRSIPGMNHKMPFQGVELRFIQCRHSRTRWSDRKRNATRSLRTFCIFGVQNSNITQSLSLICLFKDPLLNLFGDHRLCKLSTSFGDRHFR